VAGRPEALEAQLGLAELKLEFGAASEALDLFRRLAGTKGGPGAEEVSRHAARALAILGGLGLTDLQGAGGGDAAAASGPASAPAGDAAGAIPGGRA